MPTGEVPRTAPAGTVGLYWAAEAGQTPTRWMFWRALMASPQFEYVARLEGMATGGTPRETTTAMVVPSLADVGRPPERAPGCWVTIRPAARVML